MYTLRFLVLALLFANCSVSVAITIDFVEVGNAGNIADTNGYGAVRHEYRIASTEVTNVQYAAFLNSADPTGRNRLGLFQADVTGVTGGIDLQVDALEGIRYVLRPGRENWPAVLVDWYDSIRFTNWLHNGQGSGDTESGAYTLLGGDVIPVNGFSITRNADARYFLPSEDEWYKAAYHNSSTGTGRDYYVYATSSNATPVSDQPSDNPAAVNYFNDDRIDNGFNDGHAVSGSPDFPSGGEEPFADAGAYFDAVSSYGTFDQNGSVWEWTESLVESSFRTIRGGSWQSGKERLRSSARLTPNPTRNDGIVGFRVASVIPEPSAITLLATLIPFILHCRRCK